MIQTINESAVCIEGLTINGMIGGYTRVTDNEKSTCSIT